MEEAQVTLTADVIIEMPGNKIVLAQRKYPPFAGSWALPGGKLDAGETIEETAIREAAEETGLKIKLTGLIGVYSKPGRDSRGRYISVLFSAVPVGGKLEAGSDAMDVQLVEDVEQFTLAFDHMQMIKDYQQQKNNKLLHGYTP